MHQDLNLTTDDVQVDVINSSGMNGRVDAFVTDGNCDRLFSASYNGTVTSPLCTIYIGPVSTGMTRQRKAMRPGKYRVFEPRHTQPTPSPCNSLWKSAFGVKRVTGIHLHHDPTGDSRLATRD
jgi:hypothetical protein